MAPVTKSPIWRPSIPPVADSWIRFSKALLDGLYPAKCALCGLLGGDIICPTCRTGFRRVEPSIVHRPEDSPLAYRAIMYRYEDRAAQAVRRLKYSRVTGLAETMGSEIAEAVFGWGLDADMVVPVPIHWTRRSRRGFNQAEVLCEGLPHDHAALSRIRATRHQVGLSRSERESNLAGAFRASDKVRGKRILLVDDVVTSGHTARECARALAAAGALEVGILAYCGET